MKIIQSYWSKPMRINDNTEAVYRSNGGWCKKIYFYASWALSCLRLAKMYDDVELYTDSYGKHILYEMLELPYTNVSTDLECLDSLNHNLWAFGKIYTYSLQSQPFLHVDSDVYMWKKFDDRIMSADVVGQSLEENYVANIDYFNRIEKVLTYIPDAIRNARKTSPNDVIQLNAGILGGNDMAFFREYTREAFMMVDKNYDSLSKLNNHGLSGGQLQRLLIARALYKESNYIFLDEFTNSLDAHNEMEIIEKLQKREKKKTIVIIAHRFSTIKNADQIIAISDGTIKEIGKHEELMNKRGIYYKLMKDQIILE